MRFAVTRSARSVGTSCGGGGPNVCAPALAAADSAGLVEASTVPASKIPVWDMKPRRVVPVFVVLFDFIALSSWNLRSSIFWKQRIYFLGEADGLAALRAPRLSAATQ